MSTFADRWRVWTTLPVASYLFFSPWMFGISAGEPSAINAWVASLGSFALALCGLDEAGFHVGESEAKVGIGIWMLLSPFVLGFAGFGMAYSAWIVGALIIVLTDWKCNGLVDAFSLRYRHFLRSELLEPFRADVPERGV